MIRMNVKAFLELQGDISDAAFARKMGISRSQLWRIRTEKSVNDYFFVVTVPEAAQKVADDTRRANFFASPVPLAARKGKSGTAWKRGDGS